MNGRRRRQSRATAVLGLDDLRRNARQRARRAESRHQGTAIGRFSLPSTVYTFPSNAIMSVTQRNQGATMSAVIDRPRGLTPTIGGSTYVKPSEMDWKPTRFEKVSIKVLYEDAERGCRA